MELRLPIARTTKDVDLTLLSKLVHSKSQSEQIEFMREILVKASRLDMYDYFEFEISGPIKDVDATYGGARFRAKSSVAGKEFATFHVDIAIGDPLIKPIEISKPEQLLEFAGISTSEYPLISKEQHFAEKVHIYTRPDLRENSRVKDLVDMILLIKNGMDPKKLRKATEKTFERRNTHKFSEKLLPPPTSWEKPFAEMASKCKISQNMSEGFSYVESYVKTHLSSRHSDGIQSESTFSGKVRRQRLEQ